MKFVAIPHIGLVSSGFKSQVTNLAEGISYGSWINRWERVVTNA